MTRNQDVVETLLSKVVLSDLAEALGMAVIKRQGNIKALCPFHEDTTPSLVLYDHPSNGDRPHFHCFACGAHGDIFHLTQEKLGKTFSDAVTWLAKHYGVPLPVRSRSEGVQPSIKIESGFRRDGLQRALEIFAAHAGTKTGIKELAETRRFKAEFLHHAGLVIATPNVLKKAVLSDNGHRRLLADIEAAELLRAQNDRQPEQTSYHLNLSLWREFFYDSRAIFPIRRENGDLVGLAGRALVATSNQSPKYLYTPGFKRTECLYRAEVAFPALRDEAKHLKRKGKVDRKKEVHLYIVEGLFDALRLESLGQHAVAILGSDLSSKQADSISELSMALSDDFGILFRCHVFLDRDDAGVRGAAKALRLLMSRNVEVDYFWDQAAVGKDPDESLKSAESNTDLLQFLQPPVLALLADALGVLPDEILKFSSWDQISPQRLRTAAERIVRDASTYSSLPDSTSGINLALAMISHCGSKASSEDPWWLRQFRLLAQPSSTEGSRAAGLYLEDDFARLDYARHLAWSSIQRGELPVDELAWRRIDQVSALFNRSLVKRLGDSNDSPIDPFDTIWVPRGFDQSEHRTKSLPTPEDLILQQYMLAELLSERLGPNFSNSIPAVRHSRRASTTVTTGEFHQSRQLETLSFAYQIDMDVLEGWQPPRESGIFRHYWECWQDFIRTLRQRTSKFNGEIHSVRLDLKRFYDNVTRGWVRDILLPSLQNAIQPRETSELFAPLMGRSASTQSEEIASKFVEWLLKQSFGYGYYSPSNGDEKTSAANVGLPQGPDLSAYLATVALFPIDRVMRQTLDRLNEDPEAPRAVYVRYVDDIVLAADSESTLSALRRTLEDALRGTNLEAINKHGPVRPMSQEEFSLSLTEHRAFTASMPAPGFCLSPDGDGAAYFDGEMPENRSDALIVLNDPRLYFASRDAVIHGISSALSVHGELRHNELVKAARWLWYLLAERRPSTIERARSDFFNLWHEAFLNANLWSGMDVALRPWSDPVAYAIEGLDRLLSEKVLKWFRFTEAEEEIVGMRLKCLADLVALPDIHKFFEAVPNDFQQPVGWGQGLPVHLQRMFIQRLSAIRGKAFLLRGKTKLVPWKLPTEYLDSITKRSLRRADINDIECSGHDILAAQTRDGSTSTWSNSFAILHEAIARLRAPDSGENDPIKSLGELIKKYPEIKHSTEVVIAPLLLWFEDTSSEHVDQHNASDETDLPNDTLELALNTFVAATPIRLLPGLLSHRFHLLKYLCDADEKIVPIPTIDTSHANSSKPFLYFFCGDTKLYALSHNRDVPPETPFFNQEWKPLQDHPSRIVRWVMEAGPVVAPQQIFASPYEVNASNVIQMARLTRTLIARALSVQIRNSETETLELPISAAHIYRSQQDSNNWEVISSPVVSASLGNNAFIRDGSSGLRSVAVPLEDAWLWRIGVSLTDYFGFSDDLDHFAPLPAGEPRPRSGKREPHPAWHIMREALFRLRGDLSSKRPGNTAGNGMRYVPAGINRLVNQLERFPPDEDNESTQHQLAYLLSIMAETEAMRLRLGETRDFSSPGVVAGFCHQLASNILRFKLKAQWTDWLPENSSNIASLRRPVLSLIALYSRVRALPVPNTSHESDILAWNALLVGTDLVIASLSLRLAVMDLAVLLDEEGFTNLQADWMCPGYFAPSNSNSSTNLLDDFQRGIGEQAAQRTLDGIMPFGWLTLLRTSFEALSTRLSGSGAAGLTESLPLISSLIDELVMRVSCVYDTGENETLWPLDVGVNDWVQSQNKYPHTLLDLSLDLVRELDKAFGLRIVERKEGSFPYRDQQFDGTHHLPRWRLLTWWPDRQRESVREGDRYSYIWTEVWQGDRLISVAASSAQLAKLAGTSNAVNSFDAAEVASATNISARPTVVLPEDRSDISSDRVSVSNERKLEGSLSANSERASNVHDRNQLHAKADDVGARVRPFQRIQQQAWQERSEKENPQHVRVALLQWKVDDSYRHPLVDVGVPDAIWNAITSQPMTDDRFKCRKVRRGDEHSFDNNGDGSQANIFRPSWAEHRRQTFLRSALEACAKFKVDVLVLPEYSVRPETIIKLQQLLIDIDGAPAVYAGTYRMFGGAAPERRLENLGLTPSKDFDCQAILTLIEPGMAHAKPIISTRSKRYPSAAANEFFSPNSLVQSLFLDRSKKANTAFDPMSFFIELICSEIFIATSPSNLYFLASEYQKLLSRFGIKKTEEEVRKQVILDIQEYAARTSLNRPREYWPRRSILVVPAMTSRSADYWIFGQSAMLAAGMTTVFCNSVADKLGVGGSCFVGKASWHHREDGACLLLPTPYHGWSHGIYYSHKDGPLTDTEQALLIADIDPIHMAEGKPRPQSLSNPLQLIAYLPIIETLNSDTKSANENPHTDYKKVEKIASKMQNVVHEVGNVSGSALHHTTNGLANQLDELAACTADSKPFIARTKAWRLDSTEQPYFGRRPPALVDWLWVDLTPRFTENEPDLPTLLIPPWGSGL